MSEFLSVSEVANLLGVSKQAIQKACKVDKYTTRQVPAKGGKGGLRYEIELSSLPDYAQADWKKQQANAVIALIEPAQQAVATVAENTALVVAAKDDLSRYTQDQRDGDLAIRTIMRWLDSYQGTRSTALRELNQSYHAASLPSPLMSALARCKQKASGKAKTTDILTQSTLDKWLQRFKKQGNYVALVRSRDLSVKPWHEAAVALFCRPQKPTYVAVVEELAKLYKPPPTYDQVRDFFVEQFSQGEALKGRNTGMQLRAMQYHRKRTAAGMMPWDEVHADGWATHFTAPHPITGEYVTYEIWDFHDVATRYVPPFSIGLTENYEVIAKGIENAIRDGGVMAILQTDSTKIVKNNTKFVGNPVLSISDRAGITIVHPQTVGNAQANGIAENFHAWLDKQARELATYQAKPMDSLTLRRTQKLTAKLVKAKAAGDVDGIADASKQIAKTSPGILFGSYEEACQWLEDVRKRWNNHNHSSLKKVRDAVTGRMRHQTPQEALDEFKALGWTPVLIDEEHLVDLFRPRVQTKVRRGIVKPYGDMRFRHADLDHWEGKPVVVAYDIMDYRQVWVSDLQGALICVAPFDEACAYRTQTAAEASQEKRATAQIRRLEKKIEGVQKRNGLDDKVIEGEARTVLDYSLPEPDLTPKLSLDEFYALEAQQAEPAQDGDKKSFQETMLMLWGDVDSDGEEPSDKKEGLL